MAKRLSKDSGKEKTSIAKSVPAQLTDEYGGVLSDIVTLLESARRMAARSVNSIMTSTHWKIGRRIVEQEQEGAERAEYGRELLKKLSEDLTARFGRGFSRRNLELMRQFYLSRPITKSLISKSFHTAFVEELAGDFPLSWTHYIKLMQVDNETARQFYEKEALRGGWSVRQLDRQIGTQFYERTVLSKNKAAMLAKGTKAKPDDFMTPEEEIKDPYILEFLDLKDEYSEDDLEEALVQHLEHFLLELGGDFTFVGRQKRLRVGDSWFRIDLLFFHRRLRCLVVIELKLDALTPADAGQMNMYLNYAREHWTLPDENPPVGLILCAKINHAVAHYSLEGLKNKTLAAEYQTALPDEKIIIAELTKTRRLLERRKKDKRPGLPTVDKTPIIR